MRYLISHFKAISRRFGYWVIHLIIFREKSDSAANFEGLKKVMKLFGYLGLGY